MPFRHHHHRHQHNNKITICIIGKSGVGKHSLAFELTGQCRKSKIKYRLRNGDRTYDLKIKFCNSLQSNHAVKQMDEADGYISCFSFDDVSSVEQLHSFVRAIRDRSHYSSRGESDKGTNRQTGGTQWSQRISPMIFIGNKLDLSPARQIESYVADLIGTHGYNIPLFRVSARQGSANIVEAFKTIVSMADERYNDVCNCECCQKQKSQKRSHQTSTNDDSLQSPHVSTNSYSINMMSPNFSERSTSSNGRHHCSKRNPSKRKKRTLENAMKRTAIKAKSFLSNLTSFTDMLENGAMQFR